MFHEEMQSCIDACVSCAQECERCAEACLEEKDIRSLAECMRLDRDCADMCWTAAGLMSRSSHFAHDACRVCAEICDTCAGECAKHEMDHCQRCAEACRTCAEECRRMAAAAAA